MSLEAPPAGRVVYVTCCDNGLFALRQLVRRGHRFERVVTIPPHVAEKAQVSGYQDPRPFCASAGIPVSVLEDYTVRPADVGEGQLDLLVVNGWNRLIKADVMARFRHGGLAIHAGHPPIGQGRAPLPWNLIKGHTDLEVYVFRMTEHADDGDMVGRRVVEITAHDDVRTLYEKVMFTGALLFDDAITGVLAGTAVTVPQDPRFAVLYGKRGPQDGLVDFREQVEVLVDFVRGQARPYPGAFARLDGADLRVWRAIPYDRFAFRDRPRRPGEVLLALPSGLVVETGSSPVWIVEATLDGKPLVPGPLEALEALVGKRLEGREAPDVPLPAR